MNYLYTLLILTVVAFFPSTLTAATFKTQQWQTSNGTQVIFYHAPEVPMLDITVAFAGGSAYDDKFFGLSNLTANLLNQGNRGLDATAIAEKLENVGAQYSSETNRDMSVFSLKTLNTKEALEEAVSTFSLILSEPDFPKTAFQREKNQQLMAIAQAQESPDELANVNFFTALYQNHPYAHPVLGTEQTVTAITHQQVHDFYRRYFVSSNAIIVLVGAIDTQKAQQIAEQLMHNLPKGQLAPPIPKALPNLESKTISVSFPSSQTALRLGQLGIDHHTKDYFPLIVGNYILGGGVLVSRLATEIRENRGLTYGITSQFLPLPGDGPFLISFSTKNKQAENALHLTQKTLAIFIEKGPTAEELKAAKQYLAGSFPLSLASNSSIASMLLRMAFYHLPANYLDNYVAYINAVTLKEIQDAFKRHLHPDKMILVSVGKK